MPHRDPETGQFVGGTDHAAGWTQADDVLFLSTRYQASETDSGEVGTDDLEFQRDYRIVGIEAFTELLPIQPTVATDWPNGEIDMVATFQLSSTASYRAPDAPGDGGTLSPGVYCHRQHAATGLYCVEDETNGTGGAIGGQGSRHYDVYPAEVLTDVDVTPDAGTTVTARINLDDAPDKSNMAFAAHYDYRIWVARRED